MRKFIVFFWIVVLYIPPIIAQNTVQDSILKRRQDYLKKGSVVLKSNKPPVEGSIEIDRDPKYTSYTPKQLVEEVFVKSGVCSSIENVTYRAAGWDGTKWYDIKRKTLGYFNKAKSNFPLSEGLLMSTSTVANFEGPNSKNSHFSPKNPIEGDSDLSSLVPGGLVIDVAVLEFDFTPATNVVDFNYIFASEEYPYYVNTQYNDVFGFFINKIGDLNKTNIALLPDSETSTNVVSINNVNNGYKSDNNDNSSGVNPSNPKYFIPNINNSLTTEFNGYTVVLTAKYDVIPCEKYHLKLAVGNVHDKSLPSGVFLDANSFTMENQLSHFCNNNEGVFYLFEECESNVLRLIRTEDISVDQVVDMTYSGTAVNGVDYMTLDNNPLPDKVIIPAGKNHYDLNYKAIDNGIPDNGKYFDIMFKCPCSSTKTNSKRIYIYEFAKLSSLNTTCNSITANVIDGSGVYEFSIDEGKTWQKSNIFTGLQNGEYTVLMREFASCNNIQKLSTKLEFVVSAGSDKEQCGNDSFIMMEATPASKLGGNGVWTVIGVDPGVTIANPNQHNTEVKVPAGKKVTLRWTVVDGTCTAFADVTLNHLLKIDFDVNVQCNKDLIITPLSSGINNIVYSIDNGLSWYNTNVFNDLTKGTYLVTLKGGGSSTCESSIKEVKLNGILTFDQTFKDVTCKGFQDGSITITNPAGGDGNYSYSINNGVSWSKVNEFKNLSPGTYNIVLKDGENCQVVKYIELKESEPIKLITDKTDIACNGDITGTVMLSASGGIGNYKYSVDNGQNWSNANSFNKLKAGTYNVIVKDANNCEVKQTLTINQPEKLSIKLTTLDNTCKAKIDIIETIGGNGGYNYSIDNGKNWQLESSFQDLPESNYTVLVRDSKNCQVSENVNLKTDYLTIKPDLLPNVRANKKYNVQLESYAVNPTFNTNDQLPEGIFMNSSGVIHGSTKNALKTNYNIKVEVIDENGCVIEKTYALKVDLAIPEVITPNGDGKNDYFMKGYRVIIFDRFGLKIFEGMDGWDGTRDSTLVTPDTYFYILFYGEEKITGYISVLK